MISAILIFDVYNVFSQYVSRPFSCVDLCLGCSTVLHPSILHPSGSGPERSSVLCLSHCLCCCDFLLDLHTQKDKNYLSVFFSFYKTFSHGELIHGALFLSPLSTSLPLILFCETFLSSSICQSTLTRCELVEWPF